MAALAPEAVQPCRTCRADVGQPCRASDGTPGTHIHSARRQDHQNDDPARAYSEGSAAMLDWAKGREPYDWSSVLAQTEGVDISGWHPYNRGAIDTLAELVAEVSS